MEHSVIGIIGSGNVGANAAFFLEESGITDVLLYDTEGGIASGKTLDMMEAAPIRKYRNTIRGVSALEELGTAETIIISSGKGRTMGQKREDLFAENAPMIRSLAQSLRTIARDSIILIATQPVDPLVALFTRESGFPRSQVMGLGGVLDSTRFTHAISRELDISSENINALVIGRHSDDMICLKEHSRVSGVPISRLMRQDRIDMLIEETRRAGDLIVGLAERSSAYYAPSAALAELATAIHMDLHRIFSVSVALEGEYGENNCALSLPCIIGRKGILKVLTPTLGEEDRNAFKRSASLVRETMAGSPR